MVWGDLFSELKPQNASLSAGMNPSTDLKRDYAPTGKIGVVGNSSAYVTLILPAGFGE